ncbi:MAG: ribonuclease H-like domain-containing protein [Treponema sp.]|jgi:uncharacterized protein YprB with RNaseH-like and TPR domain|nr:ribonuclease H-like domain-containing protein [Treponema sp.]
MAQNLKNRLQQIREAKTNSAVPKTVKLPQTLCENPFEKLLVSDAGLFPDSKWKPFGYQVLKRTVNVNLPFSVPASFPNALALVVPDLFRYGNIPKPGDLVFFDLETTGLSGGAGTLAFLASFGRINTDKKKELIIEQYLLLDYPGEADFIEAAKAELSGPGQSGVPSLIVSYNGKTFDSQIFKNRCLMNAIVPPDYFHADLLHPSRRLWKHILNDCSQGTIETEILGLDRSGDTPGALAPEIWFSFLRNGNAPELIGISDHNIRDIMGLASLFLLLGKIAASPLETLERYTFDLESLALLWREAMFRHGIIQRNTRTKIDREPIAYKKIFFGEKEKDMADILLAAATERLMPRVLYAHGLDLLKSDNAEPGRALLEKLVSSAKASIELKTRAFRSLAIDAEWRLQNIKTALLYTETALSLPELANNIKDELEHRRERLLKKLLVDSY